MKIKKGNLETLFQLLKGTEGVLSLAESRTRDATLKPLVELTQAFYDDRNTIYKAFCIKDEKGNPDLVEGNKYQFPPEKLDEINAELKTLTEEEVDFAAPDTLKSIIEKSEYKPKIGEVEIIDELFSSF